jgi:cold shock CspA family protein
MEGTVIFFNRLKGWGFIVPTDLQGNDIFVHASQLPRGHRYLTCGDLVGFELGPQTKDRRVAVNVQIIKEAPQPNGGAQ